MPEPERETMDLREWQELCRHRDEASAVAKAEEQARRQVQELSPAAQQLSPQEQRVYQRWSMVEGLTLVYSLTVGWVGTLIFGLVWIPGLPSALLSYGYRAVPAQMTRFEPQSCGKRVGGPPQRGVQYIYKFKGREYTSSRALPFPLFNDHLDNCGQPLWDTLAAAPKNVQTGERSITAYINPLFPTVAVLWRGIPVSLPGLWGLFSLICALLTLWSRHVVSVMLKRGAAADSPPLP